MQPSFQLVGVGMALLIHGTDALSLALEKASEHEAHYSYGGDTLTTEEARKAMERMSFPLMGVKSFAVVIGAVDKARGSATDALLKGIEEHETDIEPILWATSLSEVPPTIRSRCHTLWADGGEPVVKEEYQRLARNCVQGNYANVIIQLKDIDAKPLVVLYDLANALKGFDFQEPRVSQLWTSVRLALRQEYSMSKNELLGVLCF